MDRAEGASIGVEVIYSPRAGEFDSVRVQLPRGSCVRDALRQSGMLERHPQLDLAQQPLGIWGKRRSLDDALRDGDRVEIYRPLLLDPMEARRQRQQGQAAAGSVRRKAVRTTGNRTK